MKPTLAPWQFLSFYKSLLQWKTSQYKFLNFLKAANASWNFKVKNYILLNLYKCVWMWNFFNPLIEKRPGQKFQAFYNWIIHPVKGKKDVVVFKDHFEIWKNEPGSVYFFPLTPCMCAKLLQSYPTLCNPMDCSLPGSSVVGVSRQECRSGLPVPSPGDLPNPGIEPGSPALQADALPSVRANSGR